MKHYLLPSIFLLSFFTSHSISAQEKYESGYIIAEKQDTIKGFIDYRNWSKNPEEIHFKNTIEGEEKVYGFSKMTGFHVHDEHYMRAEVTVDVSPYKSNQLSDSPIPQTQQDTVFLMVLTEGPKSLYYLKDKSDKVHFYIRKDQNYELLNYYQYKLATDSQSGIITIDRFKQQLQEYFSDCPGMQRRISMLSYSKNRLTKIFKSYYEEFSTSKPSFVQKTERVSVQTGVLAGLSATKISFKGSSAPYLTGQDFPVSYNISAGAFLNLVFPRTQRKLSLYNELIFTSFKTSNHTEEYVSDQNHSFSDVSLGYSYIKLNNMIRYKFPMHAFDLFINAGLSNGLVVSETNSRRKETYFFSDQGSITEIKAIEFSRKHEEALLAGIGGTVKKYSLEFRYETSNGMSGSTNIKSPVKRYYFLLSYRF